MKPSRKSNINRLTIKPLKLTARPNPDTKSVFFVCRDLDLCVPAGCEHEIDRIVVNGRVFVPAP